MMTSETIGEAAEKFFQQGASCAQAVLSTCGKALGYDEAMLMKLGSGMGAGMGGLRECCGAVSAMAMILGLRYGYAEAMTPQEKAALYKKVEAAVAAFDATFTTHQCKALLQRASIRKQSGVAPEARTADYYKQRPCGAFVRFCAALAMAT